MVRYIFLPSQPSSVQGASFFCCCCFVLISACVYALWFWFLVGATTHQWLYARVISNVTNRLAQFPVVVYLFTLKKKNRNIRDRFAPLDLCNRFIFMFFVIYACLSERRQIIIIICNISQGSGTHTHNVHRTPTIAVGEILNFASEYSKIEILAKMWAYLPNHRAICLCLIVVVADDDDGVDAMWWKWC